MLGLVLDYCGVICYRDSAIIFMMVLSLFFLLCGRLVFFRGCRGF